MNSDSKNTLLELIRERIPRSIFQFGFPPVVFPSYDVDDQLKKIKCTRRLDAGLVIIGSGSTILQTIEMDLGVLR